MKTKRDETILRQKKKTIGENLALFSIKHEVTLGEFFSALLEARDGNKAKCGQLSIECRGKVSGKQIFLIRNDLGVVAQIHVSEDFLLESGNAPEKFMSSKTIRKYLFKKRKATRSYLVKDLRSGMNHINLKAKILEIPEPTRVFTRFGNYANVAKALVGDETGTIRLCLWNKQIDAVSVGDTVCIRNAAMSTFRGEKQLKLGMKGVLNGAEHFDTFLPSPLTP